MRDIKALAFVCALFVACATTDSGGGDDGTDPPPPSSGPVCGDAVCAASEIGVCQADCGSGNPSPVCGNGNCEQGEATSCTADCAQAAVCGNGTCESTENSSSCPGDCTTGGGTCPSDPLECFGCLLDASLCSNGMDPTMCQNCILGGTGGGGGGGCPNGTCDAGETAQTCPFDCM